jgi:hypothetical protein
MNHESLWHMAPDLHTQARKKGLSRTKSIQGYSTTKLLGKGCRKSGTTAISEKRESEGLQHDGQFRCRQRRLATDAVARMIQEVEVVLATVPNYGFWRVPPLKLSLQLSI